MRSTLATRALLGISFTMVVAACGGSATPAPTTKSTAAAASSGTTAAASSSANGGASSGPSVAASTDATTPDPNATPTPTPFQGQSGALTLVAYSTPKSAYDAIIPLWQATADGSGVDVETSYGASGDQSRAVDGGLPADVVAFSLAPDVDRLVKGGQVDAELEQHPDQGDGDRQRRRLRGPQGQPEEHQDLG